jgi:hypothetical protein
MNGFLIKHRRIQYISVSKKKNYTDLNIPFTGNLFVGFKQALGFKNLKNKYQN